MRLQLESGTTTDYLDHMEGLIDYEHPLIQEKVKEFEKAEDLLVDRARIAFNYVRDEIEHSFDTESKVITVSASETMAKSEGICFAKSHLLAALLRGMGIPTGFCYQRVLRKGTIESGYALHGLNAVYLKDIDRWFRVDPRGNKKGIQSEFNVYEEKLAYTIKENLGEIDYPHVFMRPLNTVINAMYDSEDCHQLFYKRPELLST